MPMLPQKSLTSSETRAAERHYSVQEIAGLWGLSDQSVTRMFEREPGVLAVNNSRRKFARKKQTLRIPESVVERVHRKLEVA